MAPPLTLSLSGSRPSCLPTATAWAAKASLASTRSRSFTVQPAFFKAACEAGPPGDDPGQRRDAPLLGLVGAHQHQRGCAVIDARSVAGGDRAAFLDEGR